MTPIIRALTAMLGRTAAGTGASMAGLNALDFGKGELVQKVPNGQSWDDIVRPAADPQGATPNSRVADAFGAMPQAKPIDRINAAFEALQQNANRGFPVAANTPGTYDANATMMPGQTSQGGVDIPNGPGNSPMVSAPPPAAPAPQDPRIGFFLRNALAQRDQESGQYLNPEVGQQAMNSPFKGLFG